jgi:hypothetical protein
MPSFLDAKKQAKKQEVIPNGENPAKSHVKPESPSTPTKQTTSSLHESYPQSGTIEIGIQEKPRANPGLFPLNAVTPIRRRIYPQPI